MHMNVADAMNFYMKTTLSDRVLTSYLLTLDEVTDLPISTNS